MMLPRILRALAIAIAILAVIDPTLTRTKGSRATVALVSADPVGDSTDLVSARRALGDDFIIIDGPFAKADASVIVGNALPDGIGEMAKPIMRVSGAASGVTIERLDVPRQTSTYARLAVTPTVRVRGANGRSLAVSLRANGVAVATATVPLRGDDALVEVPLSLAPAAGANVDLHLTASIGAEADSVDALVGIAPRPWRVLFRDARASWASTFVRRAIERDPRFEVTSRIGMTGSLASDAGRPPSLDNRAAMDDFDVVVLGAASESRDLAAIEPYLRRRGGSVIVLPDTPIPLPNLRSLNLSTSQPWSIRSGGSALPIGRSRTDSSSLRAIELTWPATLPAGAEAIAFTNVSRTDSTRHPIVWSMPVGAGHLVVSGALDAWRFRDAATSSFDSFWRELIATEAWRAPKAIELRASPSVLEPGARTAIGVTLRAPSIAASSFSDAELRASIRADLRRAGDSSFTPLPLWPDASIGAFSAALSAPGAEGDYEVRVIAGRDTAFTPISVKAGARAARPDASGTLDALALSTGGATVDVDALGDALTAAIKPAARAEPSNPMRSAWWILPFALLLSGEWWLRRRKGAP